MQRLSYKKLLSALIVCCSFFISPIYFSAAKAESRASSSLPPCSGTEVSSCGTYTSSSACLTTYYVWNNDEAIYCSWNGTNCTDGGRTVHCMN